MTQPEEHLIPFTISTVENDCNTSWEKGSYYLLCVDIKPSFMPLNTKANDAKEIISLVAPNVER